MTIAVHGMTALTDAAEAATTVVSGFLPRLLAAAPGERLELTLSRHWHEPHVFEFSIRLEPVEAEAAALERVCGLAPAGHDHWDDGRSWYWDSSMGGDEPSAGVVQIEVKLVDQAAA